MSTVPVPKPERRRAVAIGALCAALALLGLGDTFIGRHGLAGQAGINFDASETLVSSGPTSSAWYCAGPLPVGVGKSTSQIAVANVTDHEVAGTLTVATTHGATTTTPISVAPRAQSLLALPTKGVAGSGAATVLIDTTGVGVAEIVRGPSGVSTSTCVTHASANAYLAAGGTKDPANVTLSLYDPGSTPAVASVSFATTAGPSAPPAFQGIAVQPGEILTLDVGTSVLNQTQVATIVSTEGGHVVVGASETVAFRTGTASSIVSATPTPERKWFFGGAPAGSSTRQSFFVLNPGTHLARVVANFVSKSGSAEVAVNVSPGALTALGAAPDADRWALRSAIITSSVPIVVERSTTIVNSVPNQPGPTRSIRVPSNKKGVKPSVRHVPVALNATSASLYVPALDPGFAVTGPAGTLASTWLLPGGEVDPSTSELVTLTNPGRGVVRVSVSELGSASSGPNKPLVAFTMAPHTSRSVALSGLVKVRTTEPIVVSASAPILSEQLLYARGGSVGFSASGAIPVD